MPDARQVAILGRMSDPRSCQVLYLGDGAVDGAASYLLGIAHRAGIAMHHVPSNQRVERELWERPWDLVILSDYPSALVDAELLDGLESRVKAGMGLWMIGGWASYRGLNGAWNQTSVAPLLPVSMQEHDDRINCESPAVACVHQEHIILGELPFAARPPSVGGYNRVTLRSGAQLLLGVQQLGLHKTASGQWALCPGGVDPLLAVSQLGQGRVLAWMTDVAPHWIGGWVDWGQSRITARHPASREVEVGQDYAQFVLNMLDWVLGKIG